jgi:hypothetical protein
MNLYRYVAYSTPRSSMRPKGMIREPCWCDLEFMATPPLQNHAAGPRLKNVMSPVPAARRT